MIGNKFNANRVEFETITLIRSSDFVPDPNLVPGAITDGYKREFHRCVDAEAKVLAIINEDMHADALQQSRHQVIAAEATARELESELNAVRSDQDRLDEVPASRVVFTGLCIATCFIGEFAFTHQTLPPLFDIPRASFLGYCLGAVPVAAASVLEFFLKWGLGWVRARFQHESGGGAFEGVLKWAAIGLMVVGFVTGNLLMIGALADAREESARVEQQMLNDNGLEAINPDRGVIQRAVVLLSFLTVLDGALLLMIFQEDLAALRKRRIAKRQSAQLACRLEAHRTQLTSLRASESVRQLQWEQREQRAAAVTGAERGRKLLQLQQAINHKTSPIPLREFVEMVVGQAGNGALRQTPLSVAERIIGPDSASCLSPHLRAASHADEDKQASTRTAREDIVQPTPLALG